MIKLIMTALYWSDNVTNHLNTTAIDLQSILSVHSLEP